MFNLRYTQAEAEQNFLRSTGLFSLALGSYLLMGLITKFFDLFKKFHNNAIIIGFFVVVGILVFAFLIFSFFAVINDGLEIRKRTFLRFRFDDEYVSSLSKNSDSFAVNIGMACLLFTNFFSNKERDIFGISTLTVEDHSALILSIMFIAYSIPILSSYWKRDE